MTADHRGINVLSSDSYYARFWFYVVQPYSAVHRDDVFCIDTLRIGVESENLNQRASRIPHTARRLFAEKWTTHIDEMCRQHTVLRRLKMLYDLVAVAEAVRSLGRQPFLDHLIADYRTKRVATAPRLELEELYGLIECSDGLRHLVRVSGGIELRSEIKFLNYGDVSPLRSIVIDSRPGPDRLTWPLPLKGWHMPNADDLRRTIEANEASLARNLRRMRDGAEGCSMLCQSVILKPAPASGDGGMSSMFLGFPELPPPPILLSGVSMRMTVTDSLFQYDNSGGLGNLRERLLKSRPASDSGNWTIQEGEVNDGDK